MKDEEIENQQRAEIIAEMAKAQKQRPNQFSLDVYLRAVRNFDPDLVRDVCVELCVNLKRGMPKADEINRRLRLVLRLAQVRPEQFRVGPPTNYKVNAGFIAMAVRLGLEYPSDRWIEARRKWDLASQFQRDIWKERARGTKKGVANV